MNNLESEASNLEESSPEAGVEDLVRRSKAGDDRAFGELVQIFHSRVYGVIYRMVNDAELARELAQQAWVRAWQRLHTYKGESRFFTWLYRVAVNTVLDEVRRSTRRREVSLDELPEREPSPAAEWQAPDAGRPDASVSRDEIWKAFEAALQRLTPEHRAALILREVEGLSYREIAEVMKCRTGTVMSRLFYARREMQRLLKDLL
ncbi:MAG: sigma-70 family RNA polymerase sigma factor [Kiritimatiellae bacterium]|nr:sigma-70 family RNA polymerase sigma factor [Kiritimatiellia bacterium]MDW8457476.1 sigma-70 family RNA polymerase sigma factor [Verrucomicrobiota bacterium]